MKRAITLTIASLTLLFLQGIGVNQNTDLRQNFRIPPSGYGEVPFYWWLGDTLTREHLTSHLDMLAGKSISSLQVNYAHSDKGGKSYGLTFESQPKIFSDQWWELFGWFMVEAKKRGMTVSLSDYTLGVGQGQYVDDILRENPELTGAELRFQKKKVDKQIEWKLDYTPLSLMAYRLSEGQLLSSSAINLAAQLKAGVLNWQAPQGEWVVTSVYAQKITPSYDPTNPKSGKLYVQHFFQKFEDRFPEESKGGLNFFFSDELSFLLRGHIWSDYIKGEFIRRKGYDITSHLAALFENVGDLTAKYRLDYNDVMVSLSEQNYFEPIYRWHEERGLTYGCDHGGRGRDVVEFGDYFRTQRWNQAPGCDQPRLGKNLIKNKVAASISHMYERPRVWLEGFYSSGWGTSTAMLTDAVFVNMAQGHNLISLHGLYYSTLGGWWEWAPPCNHFHMPYWQQMESLLKCMERLSYLLSQGKHCADVAMLYPVEPVVAGDGKESVQCAFAIAEDIYYKGIDFDFMDYESLARAEVAGNRLSVSGEQFRVLIIPDMKTIRYASLQKAVTFKKAGGVVLCIGQKPQATERGKADRETQLLIDELDVVSREDIVALIDRAFQRDFRVVDSSDKAIPHIMHRKIEGQDIYAVYGVEKGKACFFRCHGAAELWNPWTGETSALSVMKVDNEGTYIEMPGQSTDMQVIVFNPNQSAVIAPKSSTKATRRENIDGVWQTEIIPILNNQWGDFHWPATKELIGAEIREVNCGVKIGQDTLWRKKSVGFGEQFMILEALDKPLDHKKLLAQTESLPWQPYDFSWRYGVEGDYGHQGYHGLKGEMYDDFIRLGKKKREATQIRRVSDERGNNYYLYTNVIAPRAGEYVMECGKINPENIWINGSPIDTAAKTVTLKKGVNRVILHYRGHCTTYIVFKNPTNSVKFVKQTLAERPISMKWNGDLSILPFVTQPDAKERYFSFTSAPGLKKLELSIFASNIKIWIDGKRVNAKKISTREDKLCYYQVDILSPQAGVSSVMIEAETSCNGATAIPYPIKQTCGKGEMSAGDWSKVDGLKFYSGGLCYTKNIVLERQDLGKNITLDLGNVVSTASVSVNGNRAEQKITPPWRFDITDKLKAGENRIEITVFNTVANHYLTIPTEYRGGVSSGLLGPVLIIISE